MSIVTVESVRRDGKYMVRFEYPGAPNAFGGHYPARIFRKIMGPAQLIESLSVRSVDSIHYGYAANLRPAVEAARAAKQESLASWGNA